MLLLLNAIVASLDGIIIGISLKLANAKLTIKNSTILFINNYLIYSAIIFLYCFFNFKFMTPTIATLLYLFLAWHIFKENNDNNNYDYNLSFKQLFLLSLTHSLDGGIISLNFVYDYSLFIIITTFSTFAIVFLCLGYIFAKSLKQIKKSNLISALLFVLLAILNLIL